MVKDYPVGEHKIFPRTIFGQGEYKIIAPKDFTVPALKNYIVSKFPDARIARVGLSAVDDLRIDTLDISKGLEALQNDSSARTYIQVERREKIHTTLIYSEETPDRTYADSQDSVRGEFALYEVDRLESRTSGDKRNLEDGWRHGQIPMKFEHRGNFFGMVLIYTATARALRNIDRSYINYDLRLDGHNPGPVASALIDWLNEGISELDIGESGPLQKIVRTTIA